MENLIQYVTHHPLLVGAAVLALVVVVAFESRQRATAFAAVSSQELIRLMNQGALVLDIGIAPDHRALVEIDLDDAAPAVAHGFFFRPRGDGFRFAAISIT